MLAHQYVAVDGDRVYHEYPKNVLSHKELGRKISHQAILQLVKRRGWTIVFEDDVEICMDSNKICHSLDSLPSGAEVVNFGSRPCRVLYNLLTFQYEKHSPGVWRLNKSDTYMKGYAVRYSSATKWINKIQVNFNKVRIEDHTNGMDHAYVVHDAIGLFDFFRILTFRDISSVKKKYEFLD